MTSWWLRLAGKLRIAFNAPGFVRTVVDEMRYAGCTNTPEAYVSGDDFYNYYNIYTGRRVELFAFLSERKMWPPSIHDSERDELIYESCTFMNIQVLSFTTSLMPKFRLEPKEPTDPNWLQCPIMVTIPHEGFPFRYSKAEQLFDDGLAVFDDPKFPEYRSDCIALFNDLVAHNRALCDNVRAIKLCLSRGYISRPAEWSPYENKPLDKYLKKCKAPSSLVSDVPLKDTAPKDPHTFDDVIDLDDQTPLHQFLIAIIQQGNIKIQKTRTDIEDEKTGKRYLSSIVSKRGNIKCGLYRLATGVDSSPGVELEENADVIGLSDDETEKKTLQIHVKKTSNEEPPKLTSVRIGGVERKITTGLTLPQFLIVCCDHSNDYKPVSLDEPLKTYDDACHLLKLLAGDSKHERFAIYILNTSNVAKDNVVNLVAHANVLSK